MPILPIDTDIAAAVSQRFRQPRNGGCFCPHSADSLLAFFARKGFLEHAAVERYVSRIRVEWKLNPVDMYVCRGPLENETTLQRSKQSNI
jgi:hypothetical protein